MIGTQTQVTNENGSYRFPAVPPGVYELTFELAGFGNVERLDSRRHDNITVVDVRIDRSFRLGTSARVRGFLDLFNITNSNAAETRTITSGAAFLRPTAVLAPRTARVGVRVSFYRQPALYWRLNSPTSVPLARILPTIAVSTAARVSGGDCPTAGTSIGASSA